MKKFLIVLILFTIAIGTAHANEYEDFIVKQFDFSNATDEQLKEYIKIGEALIRIAQEELDKRTGNVNTDNNDALFSNRYARFTVNAFIDDGDCLLIEYNWTNTSNSARSFMLSISGTAYQHGKELNNAISFALDKNQTTDILPGYSTVSYDRYYLEDDSEITVLLNDWINSGNVSNGVKLTFFPHDLERFDRYSKKE